MIKQRNGISDMKVLKKIVIVFVIILILMTIAISVLFIFQKLKKVYSAKDFEIETIKSKIDFDNDGIDDYTDILQGARIESEKT